MNETLNHLPAEAPAGNRVGPALDGLAQRINEAAHAAQQGLGAAMEAALLAGRLLREAKSLVSHGNWESWLHVNCALAPRTARAYMRLTKKYAELVAQNGNAVAVLPVREAIRAITSPSTTPRARAININTRDDAARAAEAFMKAARQASKASKLMAVRRLDSRQVHALRSTLHAALDELDRLAAEEVQPHSAASRVGP